MAYGVTLTGFVIKRLPEIKQEMEEAYKAAFGSGIDLSAESPLGQIIGIHAEREAELWELSEDVYDSAYPDTAEGTSLDNVNSIVGVKRRQKTFSIVTARFFGDLGTVIDSGKIVSVSGNSSARFVVQEPVTIGEGIDEVQLISFSSTPTGGAWSLSFNGQVTSSLAYNANATAVQTALRALSNLSDDLTVSGNYSIGFTVTYAGADGQVNQNALTVQTNTLINSVPSVVTVSITTVTPGISPYGDGLLKAFSSGPTAAPAGSLTVIETPVAGWTSVTNLLDATLGRDLETDPAYRIRRNQELQKTGSGTIESIRSDILALEGVEEAYVYENVTESTDSLGIPPKAFRVVVYGGDNNDIANVIWVDKPAGIETDGDIEVTVIDSMGYNKVVKFSRPTQVEIYVSVTIETNDDFPENGEDLVKAAIVERGSLLTVGDDVYATPYLMIGLGSIPGITSAAILVSDNPADVTEVSVDIEDFEISEFDTSRVEVTII